jgi:hypothetical protein
MVGALLVYKTAVHCRWLPATASQKNWMPKRGACPMVGALLVYKTAVHCESPPRSGCHDAALFDNRADLLVQ